MVSRNCSLNKHGLTQKQWEFAEEYLRTRRAVDAFEKVYGYRSENSYRMLKDRAMQKYLRYRLEQRQSTLDRAYDVMIKRLEETIEFGTPKESSEASKILADIISKKNDIIQREKEVESLDKREPIKIIISEAKKDE